MLKRKMWLILGLLLISMFFIPKEIYAQGFCSCFQTGPTSVSIEDHCDLNYSPGGCQVTNLQCDCVRDIKISPSADNNSDITKTETETKTSNSYNPSCTTNDGKMGINTALGCVPVETNKFVTWLLGWLFGVAGGIAFLLMVYGFILIATSGGDEKKMAGAKETITSAVIGLLVCIFSIFILRLIMINILQIPGF